MTVVEDGKALREWGQMQLTLLDGADEKVDLINSYWQNEINDAGDLVFPIPIKDVLELANGVATAPRLPAHIARFATAELAGLTCPRCGSSLEPVSVRNRTLAQQTWKDRSAASSNCTHCWDLIEEWIKAYDRPLPKETSLSVVMAAHDLRGLEAYGDLVSGRSVDHLLDRQDAARLTRSVLVPHSATGADALVFDENKRSSYYIARVNWKFAGEGSPTARRQAFEEWLDERLKNVRLESFDDVAATAATAVEDEVLRFISQYLDERSFPNLDASQQARVRQHVADHWGRLNLGHFFSISWSAVRAATDIKAVQPKMGRTAVAGYVTNEFGRGIEKMLSGEWERREYGPHRKSPLTERSLTLFRTILGLDILTALPSDIEDLRPAADPREVRQRLLELIGRRRNEMGEAKAGLLEAFTRVYDRNLEDMEERLAFTAALNGMDYLKELVQDAIVQGVAGEIADMRDSAAAQVLRGTARN